MLGLTFLNITSENYTDAASIESLYKEAFPEEERRDFGQLWLLLQEPHMHLVGLYRGNELLGLYLYWQLQGFYYLEYLAVAPPYRGQGIGKQLMGSLLQRTAPGLVVLEVERPNSLAQQRRIRFYENLGFTLHTSLDYRQPPYRTGGMPLPLFLMTSAPPPHSVGLNGLAEEIAAQVYTRYRT